MKKKINFGTYIKIWGIVFLAGLGLCFICIDTISAYREFKQASEEIRSDYIEGQKQLIKQEVMRTVELIRQQKSQSEELTRRQIKARAYEAHSVARHIYDQYQYTENEARVRQLVVEALRAVRFNSGAGYYFVTRLDGVSLLLADKPELEGRNLLDTRDTRGKYVVRDMIEIAEKRGEGFYEYHWTKPGVNGNGYKKISFIKRFAPLDCYLGTGLYVKDTESQIKAELLSTISRLRFGKEGYIFVNRLNGDALASNGKVFSGTKKLWEEFDDNPSQMKDIFQKEYDAAMKPGGDYIRYSHIKLTQPERKARKVSFIFGLPELKWLVGAGVYIDDVEAHIAHMQDDLHKRVKTKFLYFTLANLFVIGLVFLSYNRLSQKFKSDMDIFSSFLKRAVTSNEPVDRGQIKFVELDRIAAYANTMIEKRKQVEDTLRESQERLKSILLTNPDPVVVYDTEGIPQFINSSFTKVFGWTFDDLRGKRIPFVPEDEKERAAARIRKIYETGEPQRFLATRLTKSNKILNVNISAAIYKDVEGNTSGLVVNLTDVTEQLRLEGELSQAKKMEAIGRLAGGVAHDFNNMLSIILGNTEIMFEDLDPASPVIPSLEEIEKAARRSADLTRQLLAFARKQTILPKIADLNDVIEGLLKMLNRLMGEDIELAWHPKAALWPVKIDPSQIDQILANLCVNARDAIKDVGKVTIETDNVGFDEEYCSVHPGFRPGEYVEFSVSDNGCGMDEETIDNLFEPFFTTKGPGAGTGLGLATIYGIVKQNNGFINVYSEPGQGTTFKIYLPRYTENADRKIHEMIRETARKGNETILLVEDEISILNMTKLMLERLGYTVLPANTADEAIKISRSGEREIHLLITDVVMPSMNGRDLAEKILKSFPQMKCLFMSGYTANVIANRGVLDEGLNFINKPFSRQALSVKLREILDQPTD